MDVLIGVRVKCVVSFLVFFLAMVNVSFGQEAETIENAIKKGKISGAIGSYYEFVIKDAENSDDGSIGYHPALESLCGRGSRGFLCGGWRLGLLAARLRACFAAPSRPGRGTSSWPMT